MKKNAFSLIEIAITLPLIALLFSFLFFTLTRSIRNNNHLEKKESRALENHYFQRRLQQKLANITKQRGLPKEFFNSISSQFYFNNGFSLDPNAKGILKGKLFLEDRTLKLHLYRLSRDKEMFVREELLLKDVDSLDIDYLFEEPTTSDAQSPARYQIAKDTTQKETLTWVGITLKIGIEDTTQDYFFNFKRPGI